MKPFILSQQLGSTMPSKNIFISKHLLLEHGKNFLYKFLLGLLKIVFNVVGKKKAPHNTVKQITIYFLKLNIFWLSGNV